MHITISLVSSYQESNLERKMLQNVIYLSNLLQGMLRLVIRIFFILQALSHNVIIFKDDEIRSSGEERKAQSRWLNQHDDARYSKEPTWVIDPSGSSQEQLYNNREMGKSGNVDFKKTSNAEADDFKHACR